MSLVEQLYQPLPVKKLEHNGFPYISASDIRKRLNEVFDCKWSFEVVDCNPNLNTVIDFQNLNTIIVKGRIVVELDDTRIIKEAFGSCDIRRFTSGKNAGQPIDIGMDFQTAAVNAMKAAAKMLGVGELAASEEEHAPRQPVQRQKPAQPQAQNSSNGMSPEVAAKLAKIKAQAEAQEQPQPAPPKQEERPAGPGFTYDQQPSNNKTLEIKKRILQNYATTQGVEVNELINSIYPGTNLDTISEEQITTIISNSI